MIEFFNNSLNFVFVIFGVLIFIGCIANMFRAGTTREQAATALVTVWVFYCTYIMIRYGFS